MELGSVSMSQIEIVPLRNNVTLYLSDETRTLTLDVENSTLRTLTHHVVENSHKMVITNKKYI